MTHRRTKLILGNLAMAGLVVLASASPAFAQTTTAGGNIGTFIQMDPARMIVLRAGLPPIRGRKIVYWRERVFTKRLTPPPSLPTRPIDVPPVAAPSPKIFGQDDDLSLAIIGSDLEGRGLEPPPKEGASEAEVEAWVERFIDASVGATQQETDHVR